MPPYFILFHFLKPAPNYLHNINKHLKMVSFTLTSATPSSYIIIIHIIYIIQQSSLESNQLHYYLVAFLNRPVGWGGGRLVIPKMEGKKDWKALCFGFLSYFQTCRYLDVICRKWREISKLGMTYNYEANSFIDSTLAFIPWCN